MRVFEVFFPFVLFSSSLFSVDNFTGLNINLSPNRIDHSHFKLENQLTYTTKQEQVYLFDLIYKPYLDKTHHIESGVGFRQFSGKYGVGMNFFYVANNNSNRFGHQINYGFELFYSNFQGSFNYYHPIFPDSKFKNRLIKFTPVSEFGITYKPNTKYEFGIYPFYDHSIEKWGARASASIFISNVIELEISPHYRQGNSGITFSIGYHFGGPKSRKTQPIRKSHQMYFNSRLIKKQEKEDPSLVDESPILINPIEVPVSSEIIPIAEFQNNKLLIEIPDEIPVIEQIQGETAGPLPEPIVKKPKTWCDFFFRRPNVEEHIQ